MTESGWGEILQSGNTSKFAEKLHEILTARLEREESAESLQLLSCLKEELHRELSLGRRIPEEISLLVETLPKINSSDQLKVSMEKFLQLATELYSSRSSVNSTFTLAQYFYDKLVTVAFDHAFVLLGQEGKKATDLQFALLVSGELGRGESVLGSRSSFFFIYRGSAEDREYINKLALLFMANLSLCFPAISRDLHNPSSFSYCSDLQWQEHVSLLLKGEEPGVPIEGRASAFALMLQTAADLRFIHGDADFGQELIETGRKLIADCMGSEIFCNLAKNIASMPVALGKLLGRFKTVRTGKNARKIDLQTMAIDPLAAAVRILSLDCAPDRTSFKDRIESLLAAGKIGVALADQLLIAYQDFMRERIRLELTGRQGANGLFLNPEALDENSKERFRVGLEDITTLQRLVHQQLVEVGQG